MPRLRTPRAPRDRPLSYPYPATSPYSRAFTRVTNHTIALFVHTMEIRELPPPGANIDRTLARSDVGSESDLQPKRIVTAVGSTQAWSRLHHRGLWHTHACELGAASYWHGFWEFKTSMCIFLCLHTAPPTDQHTYL